MPATLTRAKIDQRTATRLPVEPEKNERSLKAPSVVSVASIFCFAVVSFITIKHHLAPQVVELSVLFDSASYLNSAGQVHECIRNLLAHPLTLDSIHHTAKLLSGALLLDGPVLPCLGAVYYAIIQATPTVFDMRPALVLQSLLHGLNAGLIVALGTRFTGRPLWGVLASFAWGLYPAAAIGSANFMSETLAVTLIIANLISISNWIEEDGTLRKYNYRHGKTVWAIVSGVLGVMLLLLKPALGAACAGLLAMALVAMRLTHHPISLVARRLLALSAGGLMAVLPWLMFTYVATGQPVLMPQRLPVKNLATGLNLETQGWGSIPDTEFVALFTEQDKPLPTLIGLVSQNPFEHASLMAAKLSRLWSAPWNDYRQKFLFAGTPTQMQWHYGFVALSLVGMVWFLLSVGKKSLYWIGSDRKFWLPIGLVSLAVIAGHLTYLPFAANSRYGFTAMPAFLVFGLFAVAFLTRAGRRSLVMGVAAVCALIAAIATDPISIVDNVVLAAHAPVLEEVEAVQLAVILQASLWTVALTLAASAFHRASKITNRGRIALVACWLVGTSVIALAINQSQREWNLKLTSGTSICRALPPVQLNGSPSHALILVDCDQAANAVFEVNEHKQPAVLNPLAFIDGSGNLLRDMQLFGGISGAGAQKMRQWRYAEIPVNWLSSSEENVIKMSGEKPLTVYGDYISGSEPVRVPSLWQFSATRLLSNPTATDPRTPGVIPTRGATDRTWSESTTTDRIEILDHRAPRVLLGLLYQGDSNAQRTDGRKWDGTMSGALESSGVEPIVLKTDIPSQLLYQGTLNLVLSGSTELGTEGDTKGGAQRLADVHVCLRNGTQLGHDLEFIGIGPMMSIDGTSFELNGVLPTSACAQGDHYIEAVIRPHGFPVKLNNVRVKLSSKPAPKVSRSSHLRLL